MSSANPSRRIPAFICAAATTSLLYASIALPQQSSEAVAPNFSGVWFRASGQQGRLGAVRNLSPRHEIPIGDYNDPLLKPWAAAVVKRHSELEASGKDAPEPKQTCWPGGVPNMLTETSQMELLQTPTQVTLLHALDHQVRFIYLNRPHSAHVTPSWNGESVGHYEGNILVVDTVGLRTHPMSMVDSYGTPHTQALHVIERFSKPDENHVEVEMVIDDPATFTRSWSMTAKFTRVRDEFEEFVCADIDPTRGLGPEAGDIPRGKYVSPF